MGIQDNYGEDDVKRMGSHQNFTVELLRAGLPAAALVIKHGWLGNPSGFNGGFRLGRSSISMVHVPAPHV